MACSCGSPAGETTTAPHSGPALVAPDLEAALEAIRARGLRVSAARRLMLEVLYGTDEPLSAEGVAEHLGPHADVASVYRNLEALEALGLVRHFHLGHGPGLYVRTGTGVREYLVCSECRTVRAVAPEELDGVREEIRRAFGHEATFTHYPIVGRCADCAAR